MKLFSPDMLRQKTKEELLLLCGEQRGKVLQLRMRMKSAGLKNVKELRAIRKTIAQILTILRSKS